MMYGIDECKCWFVFIVFCLGVLMIVLDMIIVNVVLLFI